MDAIKSYRLRKCSDVDMENPYFEVLDESEITIFDISKTNQGELRILFYDGASSKYMTIEMLDSIVEEAKKNFR